MLSLQMTESLRDDLKDNVISTLFSFHKNYFQIVIDKNYFQIFSIISIREQYKNKLEVSRPETSHESILINYVKVLINYVKDCTISTPVHFDEETTN